jgi:DNA-binding transcriptional ArsR family regulator
MFENIISCDIIRGMDVTELVLHPVRLRLIHALSADRELTTSQLCARLPEVSTVTVYRHVALLLKAGFLEIADERRIRGVVERRYRLRQDRPRIDEDDASAMSLEEHRRGFDVAMAVLVAEFHAYLECDGASPTADGVSYRQGTFWLTPGELGDLHHDLLRVLQPRLRNAPTPGRLPFLLSPIVFPNTSAEPQA